MAGILSRLTIAPIHLCLALAGAGTASASGIIDMTGSWTAQYQVSRHNNGGSNYASGIGRIVITGQDGRFLSGYSVWVRTPGLSEDIPPNAEQALENAERDPFIGVLSPNGARFVLTETGDTGSYHGHVVDADRIEVMFIESKAGQAVVASDIFTRDTE